MLIVKRICAQPALRKSEGSLKTEHVGFLRMIHYPHCKNAAKLVHAALAQTEIDEGDALTGASGNNEGAVFKWLSSLVGARRHSKQVQRLGDGHSEVCSSSLMKNPC